MVKGGADVSGKRILVGGSGPLLLAVAAYLAEHDAELVAVLEQASPGQIASCVRSLAYQPGKLLQGLGYRLTMAPTRYQIGHWVTRAFDGGAEVTDGTRRWKVECDAIALGYGLVPNTELARLLGCETRRGAVIVDDRMRTTVHQVFAVGETVGIGGLAPALIEGEIAGLVAVRPEASVGHLVADRKRERDAAANLERAFTLRRELTELAESQTLVCRCEDVTLGELREFGDARSTKMHSRCGMGACQGRICGEVGRFLLGWEEDTVRPPLSPVPAAFWD
jgi:NADPH-dependent 2,4-dienoyl-CoA reductase/sulfur reductase-like enzyme